MDITFLEILGAFALFILIVLCIGWCLGFVKFGAEWVDK